MIHVKDHKTYDMFNHFGHLGPKRLAMLESSWAHLFREEILHHLPVDELCCVYNESKGRQTKELYAMLGLVLLQQMEDLTDEETIQQFSFNILWQYALNVTDDSDCSCYVSLRTLWTVRDHVGKLGLDQTIFSNVSTALAKLFDLDTSKQRIDSVHIFSNMAHLGRIRLFVKTIRKFLVNLKRHHAKQYQELGELTQRYEKKNDGQFAVKPSDSSRTIQQVGDDCFALIERFQDQDAIVAMSSYQLLQRLFSDQCGLETNINCDSNATTSSVIIKPSKEVQADSLQNPSDPDAGYCGHKGQGYQVQVMETYSPEKTQPDIITHVCVEAANESDANAVIPAIKDAKEHNLAPNELLADSLYGSDDNISATNNLGTTLIAPAMGTREPQHITIADFEFCADNKIVSCPAGHCPYNSKIGKKGGITVYFNKADCDSCPNQSACPAKRHKKFCTISYDAKALRLARRRKHEQTDQFKEQYRFRAGSEATMSDLDRVTNIKHLRVRAMIPVRVAATLKATGLNIRRATAFIIRGGRPQNKDKAPVSSQYSKIVALAMRIMNKFSKIHAIAV